MITINDITDSEKELLIEALANENRVNLYMPKHSLDKFIKNELAAKRVDDDVTTSITLTVTGYLLAREFSRQYRS